MLLHEVDRDFSQPLAPSAPTSANLKAQLSEAAAQPLNAAGNRRAHSAEAAAQPLSAGGSTQQQAGTQPSMHSAYVGQEEEHALARSGNGSAIVLGHAQQQQQQQQQGAVQASTKGSSRGSQAALSRQQHDLHHALNSWVASINDSLSVSSAKAASRLGLLSSPGEAVCFFACVRKCTLM